VVDSPQDKPAQINSLIKFKYLTMGYICQPVTIEVCDFDLDWELTLNIIGSIDCMILPKDQNRINYEVMESKMKILFA
jgi:hypothetical protein